jgi:hypothetical protein
MELILWFRESFVVFEPDKKKLRKDLPENMEGIVNVNPEADTVLRTKSVIGVGGQYSWLDLLWLGVVGYRKKDLSGAQVRKTNSQSFRYSIVYIKTVSKHNFSRHCLRCSGVGLNLR